MNKNDHGVLRQLGRSAGKAAGLLDALSNESRLLVLCHLTEGEKSVGALQAIVGLSQSALSQHLAILRRKRIVETRRDGQQIYYRLASPAAEAVIRVLHQLYCAPKAPRRSR